MPPKAAPDKVAEKVAEKVATAFTDAQRTSATHARATKLLLSAFDTAPVPFVAAFTHALNRILLVFSRDPNIERLATFVARFSSQAYDSGDFCSLVLTYLLSHGNARGRAVRFRITQLIATVLHHLPEDTELADEVWAPLREVSMSRSFDKLPRVRAAAAGALCRLQTTGSEDDPFCGRLVEMLTSDSSAAVRKASLEAVAVTDHTLIAVAGRTRDVNVEVRKAAYETLAAKINPSDLHTAERVALLNRGLGDRVAEVRNACENQLLLDGWLDGACEGNAFELVDLLGCEEYEEDVLRALRVVFKSQRFDSLIQAIEIDVNNLTHADVLLLRAVSDTKKGEEAMEKFLPSALLFAEVLRYYAVNDFASRHLLELCRSVDMSDEAGRQAIENVIRTDFLSSRNVNEQTVESGVRAMRRVAVDEESTCRLALDILRDVLNVDEAEEDGSEQEKVSTEDRSWQKIRALNISREVLRIARQGASTGSPVNTICLSILELAVLPHLMSENEAQRRTAMECLGLFCLLDKSGAEAKTKMPLFIQAVKTDLPSIQELAMRVLIDFLMVFDFSPESLVSSESSGSLKDRENGTDKPFTPRRSSVSKGSSLSSTVEECIDLLSQNITSGDGMMRTIAVEGLARLLFVRRISPSPTLLARLLIVHHNPSTEDDDRLRQCLSVFFPSFAMFSPQNRLSLEDAFKPTCRLISHAPSKSPLCVISLVQVAQFILHLTNPSIAPNKKGRDNELSVGKSADLIHERLAETVLNEILDSLHSEEVSLYRNYCKILSSFRLVLSQANFDQMMMLRKLATTATREMTDKKVQTVLNRFLTKLDKLFGEHDAVPAKDIANEVEEGGESKQEQDERSPDSEILEEVTTANDEASEDDESHDNDNEGSSKAETLTEEMNQLEVSSGEYDDETEAEDLAETSTEHTDSDVEEENHDNSNTTAMAGLVAVPQKRESNRRYPRRSTRNRISYSEE